MWLEAKISARERTDVFSLIVLSFAGTRMVSPCPLPVQDGTVQHPAAEWRSPPQRD